MKYIIITMFILISSVSYAEMNKERDEIILTEIESVLRMIDEAVLTETRCIKGYWFVVANSMHGVSIVQIYASRNNRSSTVPKPIKCKG